MSALGLAASLPSCIHGRRIPVPPPLAPTQQELRPQLGRNRQVYLFWKPNWRHPRPCPASFAAPVLTLSSRYGISRLSLSRTPSVATPAASWPWRSPKTRHGSSALAVRAASASILFSTNAASRRQYSSGMHPVGHPIVYAQCMAGLVHQILVATLCDRALSRDMLRRLVLPCLVSNPPGFVCGLSEHFTPMDQLPFAINIVSPDRIYVEWKNHSHPYIPPSTQVLR